MEAGFIEASWGSGQLASWPEQAAYIEALIEEALIDFVIPAKAGIHVFQEDAPRCAPG